MPLFNIPDGYYLQTKDVNSLADWYREKLGFLTLKPTEQDEGCEAVLRSDKRDVAGIGLGTVGESTTPTPIIYTGSIGKAHEILSNRNVQVGSIERDPQGTQYFQITDCEGNILEVSEET